MLVALVAIATLHALPPAALQQVPQAPARQSRSEHYDITIETAGDEAALALEGRSLDPEDLSKLLELAWPSFESSCGGEPTLARDKRFRVRIASTKDTWLSALNSEGAAPPPNVDRMYYRPETETLHLVRQDSAWSTRALLIRGAWMQFFARARPKNIDLRTRWWVTALGEHFAMHTWDGSALALGIHPIIAPVDVPARALIALDPATNAGTRLSDDLFKDPVVAWAMSELLLSRDSPEDRARFDKLVQGKSGGKLAFEEFSRAMGRPADLWKELQANLETAQMPLATVSGKWEDTGSAIAAWPAANAAAICILRQPARELAVDLDLAAGATGGIIFAWTDEQNHSIAKLERTPTVVHARVDQISKGKSSTIAEFDVGTEGRIHLRAVRKLDAVHVWFGTDERGPYEVPGDGLGLWTSAAGARFATLTWH